MESKYNNMIYELRKFTNETNRNDKEDVKRTSNYIDWCSTKTAIIREEKTFTLTEEQHNLIKRGNVFWIDFGFNVGTEFGGRHPAIIIRKMGDGVYVIPLDSGKIPDEKKNKGYFIKVPFVYDFPKMPRYCNIYKMKCIDFRRIDFDNSIGRVNGKIIDKISNALKKYIIY